MRVYKIEIYHRCYVIVAPDAQAAWLKAKALWIETLDEDEKMLRDQADKYLYSLKAEQFVDAVVTEEEANRSKLGKYQGANVRHPYETSPDKGLY